MKKETSNQFTEGLISDLNPINTPNVVLTDNLNGTIITYNGNEHSLQNDMGNYELEYCKLNPNYIPVGIKEYGDILYIVSQNPLDNSVEIGSYPSPLMIVDPDKKNTDGDVESIIESQILNKGLSEEKYTKMMENANSVIFNGDDYKLNPGDEYCLQKDSEDTPYKYETIEYQILDEDSNLHTITEKVKIDSDNDYQDFEHVAWTIPGWLTIKPRLVELSAAGINIKSFYVPKDQVGNKSAFFSFDFRLNVNDKHLVDNGYLEDWCKGIDDENLYDIRFRVFIERKIGDKFESVYNKPYVEFGISDIESSEGDFYLSKYGWGEWFEQNRIIWKNIFGKIDNVTETDVVRVSMIPILGEKEYNYKILYDNLKQEILFDLSKISDDGWTIGSELYQFYTSADGASQYIYTNVDGPKISSFPVDLNCEIYDLNGQLILKHKFEDYSGIGENLLQIPFNDTFVKEDIYVIRFKFNKEELKSDNLFPNVSKFLITSEVFNDFSTKMIYDKEISFGEWINNYWKHCEIQTNVDVEHSGKESTVFDETVYDNSYEPTESDKRYMENKKYNTFFPEYDSGLSDEIIYRKGFSDEYNVTNNIEVKHLTGPIWKAFGIYNDFKYKDLSSIDYKSLATSVIINRYMEVVCKYDKDNSFLFADINEKNFIDNLDEYTGLSDVGKITDYVVEVSVFVTGNRGDDKNETDDFTDDRKTAYCLGRILKNGTPITDWQDEITRSLEGLIMTESKENWPVGLWSDGINSDGWLWWRAGKARNKHTKEVCLFPKMLISWLFREKKLPFVLVKINYTSNAPSANWKINTCVLGGEYITDYCFNWDDENTTQHSYIAFPRRTGEFGSEIKDYPVDQEHPEYSSIVNWNPVLLPLTTDDNGVEYFRNFSEGITYIDSNPYLEPSSVYMLNKQETNLLDAVINIYHKIQFSSYVYKGVDFSSKSSKLDLIQNKFSFLDLEESDILLGPTIDSDYNLIYSKTLKPAEFDDFDLWPHKDGFDVLNKNITLWQSHATSDVNAWLTSGLYQSIQDGNNEIMGVYLKKDVDDKRLINALSDSYVKMGHLSLYAQNFSSGASGDTQPLLNDLLGKKWWLNLFTGPIMLSLYFGVAGAVGFPWTQLIATAIIVKMINNKEEDSKMGALLTTTGKASLITWTNKQAIGNSESKIYFVYGCTWEGIPSVRLDRHWDWIKYD